MDNQRLFLWLGLLIVVWFTWRAWVDDYGEPAAPTVTTTQQAPDVGQGPGFEAPPELTPGTTSPGSTNGIGLDVAAPLGDTIRVVTDVLDVLITLDGGNLVQAELPGYPIRKDQPDVPVRLLSADAADHYVLQSGLLAAGGGVAPNHQARFEAAQSEYRMQPGQDVLEVELLWQDPSGLTVRKVYVFERGWYRVGLAQEIVNASDETWTGADYVRIERRHIVPSRSLFNVSTYGFTGPTLFDGRSYDKLNMRDLARQPQEQTELNGWIAGVQHHFLVAAVPPEQSTVQYTARASNDIYQLSAVGQVVQVGAGSSHRFEQQLFVGPKLQSQLRETGERLQLTVDYGFLSILSQPLFWLLDRVHDLVRNWGWSIILVTVLIKLVFWRLTAISSRSMARMRKLTPRLKGLQERYKDDRQALSRAMLDLYKREGVNPALGCLPMLIQIPFFIAFYWVLVASVEIRQAPFMLWIDDLSSRDPFFVLPILMGVAMVIQSRLNPPPPDPIQARIMQVLPLVFTVFFAIFPAGLVLYWLTNTVLSVFQQWLVIRQVEAADKAEPKEA